MDSNNNLENSSHINSIIFSDTNLPADIKSNNSNSTNNTNVQSNINSDPNIKISANITTQVNENAQIHSNNSNTQSTIAEPTAPPNPSNISTTQNLTNVELQADTKKQDLDILPEKQMLDFQKDGVEEIEPPDRKDATDYSANSIKVLGGADAVRQTPAMYIGDTSTFGLHHLVYEIVDNSIDESLAGYCNQIIVRIHLDNSISVLDNGRGIPVDYHAKEKKSTLEVITTTLHSGGKFDRNSYKVSGGLHGVGLSVVNALSERMEIEVFRDGWVHIQSYEHGKPLDEVKKIGKTSKRGTKVWFKPDPTIFDTTIYSYGIISQRMRELSFLNQGIHISLVDERDGKNESYFTNDGIRAFVQHLNLNKNPIHPDIIYLQKEVNDSLMGRVLVELALQYHDGYNEIVYGYANNIHTREGGTHVSGLRSGLTRTFNTYAKNENILKDKDKIVLTGDDWREGLTAVISVKLSRPQFEGQTKAKLGNREMQGITESVINDLLAVYLEEHPATAKAIINKGINAAHVREATRKVRDLERQRKTPLHSGGLPGKLADCSEHNIERTELYLVEGDSAGGSAKSGRDRRFQAILPLKGKILNVEKTRLDKILAHNEIKTLVMALGTGIQTEFNIEKRRYGKVIIMTDADVDGSHIRTLLLTFFFRNMKPLIEAGYIYIAQPPLYKFKRKKNEQYVFSDQEFQNVLLKFGAEESQLKIRSSNQILHGEELFTFINTLSNLEQQLRSLEKNGISGRDFLKNRHAETGQFPKFKYKYKTEIGYFFSENELKQFIVQKEQEGQEILVQEENEHNGNGNGTSNGTPKIPLIFQEIHASDAIYKYVIAIESYNIKINTYFHTDQVQFDLLEGHENIPITAIYQIITEIRNLGRKGLDVQRYKGLGEMNPDQLWTTTMNPATRTLFQVRLEDASESDRLFSILMGNLVEPRREYIEKHALDVHNLDV